MTVNTTMPTIRRFEAIELPVPPSANMYWRDRAVVRKGGGKPFVQRYLTKEAVDYKATVKVMAWNAGWRIPIPRPTEVAVSLVWYRKARRGDLSNRLKVLEDALEGVAYENDSQIAQYDELRRVTDKDLVEDLVVISIVALSTEQMAIL